MIASDLLHLADDPHRITPSKEEVTALADKIDAAIRRVQALEPRVRRLEHSWLAVQAGLEERAMSAPRRPPDAP